MVALAFEMILPIEAGEPTTQSCCWLACFPGNCTHQIYPWLATQSIQTPSMSFFGADGFVRNFMFVCQKTRLGRNGRLRKVRPERGGFASLSGLCFPFFIISELVKVVILGSSRKVVGSKSEHLWRKSGVLILII